MTWYLPFKISIAKTDVFAIECLDQVYSDVVQEAQWNDLLHTARLLMRLDTPLHGNNARGAKYAVYYASVATHTKFENIKMAALRVMSEEKCCSPFPCFFIPCRNLRVMLLY